MNSYNTDISIFSNYYNLQSVHFEFEICFISNQASLVKDEKYLRFCLISI